MMNKTAGSVAADDVDIDALLSHRVFEQRLPTMMYLAMTMTQDELLESTLVAVRDCKTEGRQPTLTERAAILLVLARLVHHYATDEDFVKLMASAPLRDLEAIAAEFSARTADHECTDEEFVSHDGRVWSLIAMREVVADHLAMCEERLAVVRALSHTFADLGVFADILSTHSR